MTQPLPAASPGLYHPPYRRDIDGLRAIAVLAVLAFHAFPDLVKGGFRGVDLFFVLSGYLISTILWRSMEKRAFRLRDFYIRRIRRIFPALVAVLAACLLMGWWVLLPEEYALLGKHAFGSGLFITNFFLASEAGYFDVSASSKPLLHLWSLAIEEQFYLVFPLGLLLLTRWRRWQGVAVWLALLGSFALNLWWAAHAPVRAFYWPLTRAWELLAGCALAWHSLKGAPIKSATLCQAASFAGACFLIAALFFLPGEAGYAELLPVLAAVLLLAAGPQGPVNRLLASPPLVWVGLNSYALYLWHWPLLSYATILHGGPVSPILRLCLCLAALLLAWATTVWIEHPLRFGGQGKRKALALLGLLIGLALCGGGIKLAHGLPDRAAIAPLRAAMADFDWPPWRDHDPHCPMAKNHPYCVSTNPNKIPDVALIGDSHANQYFWGLAPYYTQQGLTLTNLGGGGCVPFYDLMVNQPNAPDYCNPVTEQTLDYVLAHPQIKTVIMTARGPIHVLGTGFGEAEAGRSVTLAARSHPDWQGNAMLYARLMEQTFARLTAAGKQVVWIIDPPELGFDPTRCVSTQRTRLLPRAVRQPCGVSRAAYDARNRTFRAIVAQAARRFPQVKVIDPIPYLCDSNLCTAEKDGHFLYRNDNHLSLYGSRYIASRIAPALGLVPGDRAAIMHEMDDGRPEDDEQERRHQQENERDGE